MKESDYKVIRAFQKYIKTDDSSEIMRFNYDEILTVDQRLGNNDLNSSFRIAMKNRLHKLSREQHAAQNNKAHLINYIISFILGILATVIAQWIINKYFSS